MPTLARRAPRGSSSACLDVRRLERALTLVHKYDCSGLLRLVATLADYHFPRATQPEDGGHTEPISRWLTQAHLDYIVRAQELFDDRLDEVLNATCIALLAQALTSLGLQWSSCGVRMRAIAHVLRRALTRVARQPSPRTLASGST